MDLNQNRYIRSERHYFLKKKRQKSFFLEPNRMEPKKGLFGFQNVQLLNIFYILFSIFHLFSIFGHFEIHHEDFQIDI